MAEQTLEELQQSVTDLTTQLAEAQKVGGEPSEEITRLKTLNAELIEGRDKAKARARKADEDKLSENEEFKTLSEQLKTERDDLTKQLESLNGTITSYTERDKAELATLLESVPEALRGTVSSEKIPLAEQLTLARQLATEKLAGPGARNAGLLKTKTVQEEYDKAVEDGDISKQMTLKRQLHANKG